MIRELMIRVPAVIVGLAVLAGCSEQSCRTPVKGKTASGVAAKGLASQDGTSKEAKHMSNNGEGKTAEAMFGAGCFWGVEQTFRQIEGVVDTEVGFSGGKLKNPTYKQVCYEGTGHAEVVHVTYDPSRVSYEELLDTFWKCHNPTQLNRQGPDLGDQYRSAIFVYTPEQEAAAKKSKAVLQASGKYKRGVVTVIEPAGTFYRAEEYHQQYLAKRGRTSCATTIDH